MIIKALAAMLACNGVLAAAGEPATATATAGAAPAVQRGTAAGPAAAGVSAAEKAALLVRAGSLSAAREKYPRINPDDIMTFHRQYAPDLLSEWERRCREEPTGAQAYFLLLADNFVTIDAVRAADPDEYERLLRQQKSESRVRDLSRQIQALSAHDDGGNPHRLLTRQRLKLELKQLLEQSFDEAQQRQLIEINRLEAEMRNLRRLADERAANRRLILGQRFYILTGDTWPEDVQHDQQRD
jgi:hypothetical protein